MTERESKAVMPDEVAAIADCGYATWAGEDVDSKLREKFDAGRIPVVGVRHVRVWGLQVDDERELPGHRERRFPTRISGRSIFGPLTAPISRWTPGC